MADDAAMIRCSFLSIVELCAFWAKPAELDCVTNCATYSASCALVWPLGVPLVIKAGFYWPEA